MVLRKVLLPLAPPPYNTHPLLTGFSFIGIFAPVYYVSSRKSANLVHEAMQHADSTVFDIDSCRVIPPQHGDRKASTIFVNATLEGLSFSRLTNQVNQIVNDSTRISQWGPAAKTSNDAIEFAFYKFVCSIFVYALPQAISYYPRHQVASCSLRRLVTNLTVPDRSLGSLIVRSSAFADLIRRHAIALHIDIPFTHLGDNSDGAPTEEPPTRRQSINPGTGSPLTRRQSMSRGLDNSMTRRGSISPTRGSSPVVARDSSLKNLGKLL